MPGKIIKLFDTQADWESGTLSNMDSATKPGSIAPNPSFSKTYTVGASLDWYNWKQGASIKFLYEEDEMLNPTRMIDGDISTYAQKLSGGYGASMKVTYASAHQFSGVRIYQGPLAKGRVRLLRGTAGVEVFGGTYLTASGGWKTINFSSAQDTIWKLEIQPDTIIYEIDLLPTDYYITPKTWTSSWTAFGISGSFSSTFTLNATIPSGTSVTKYVRYSSTGQDNPTWQEITGSSLPGTGGNYIQFKIELSTTDTSKTPTVNSFSVTAGPEVYWISPVIDTSRAKSDRLTIGVETAMDIKRSIRASNYTFARPSVAYKLDGTQVSANVPRFEQGKFDKALLVEEGTTNLLANPSFETGDFTDWFSSFQGGLSYWSVASDDKYHGEYCAVLAGTGVHTWRCIGAKVSNPTVGSTYTFSAYIKCDSGITYGASMRVLKSTDNGATWNEVFHSPAITSTNWSRVEKEYTVETGVNAIAIELRSSTGNAVGKKVYADACQIEKKPYATSFTPSTRSPETLTIPTAGVLNPREGTVEFVVIPQTPHVNPGRDPWFNDFTWGTPGANGFLIRRGVNTASVNSFQVELYGTPAGIVRLNYDATFQQGTPYTIAFRWSSFGCAFFVDGVKRAETTYLFAAPTATEAQLGYRPDYRQGNALYDDLRISNKARSDAEILANYQSGKPVGFDSYTTYYEPFDGLYDWQVVGVVFENPHTVSLQVKIEPSKTKIGDQYIDSLGLWDTITLPMLERPDIELAPPECNKVTVYTDTIEKSATVPGTSSDRIVEIRVEAPEGSSEAYCQQMADAILAAKSKERLSITCKVPLVTSLRFGELVPVILPYIGATIDTPYLAHVQRMEHHILENPPYTILSLGDFLPDDIEALVRLLKEG